MSKVLSEFGEIIIPKGESGVEALSDEINAIVNVYGSKNLLPYPYTDTTKSMSGVDFTDNGDGTVSATGSTSADVYFDLGTLSLPKGSYTISGVPDEFEIYIQYTVDGGEQQQKSIFSTFTIQCNESITFNLIWLFIRRKAIPAGGIVFKPMIRDARITDDTFAPYAMTNRELTNEFSNLGGVHFNKRSATLASQAVTANAYFNTHIEISAYRFAIINVVFSTLLINGSTIYYPSFTSIVNPFGGANGTADFDLPTSIVTHNGSSITGNIAIKQNTNASGGKYELEFKTNGSSSSTNIIISIIEIY